MVDGAGGNTTGGVAFELALEHAVVAAPKITATLTIRSGAIRDLGDRVVPSDVPSATRRIVSHGE